MPGRMTPPGSWADVCALYERLRQLSRETGRLGEWKSLTEAAARGTDTLDEWRSLCAEIAAHGDWYGTYVIRDPGAGSTSPAPYTCPARHRCSRRAPADRTGRAPRCGLAGLPMSSPPDGDGS
ncbi:hypothetical protein [Sphaerisporangium aureirubrum]|uniref:Uncharacterized protein n=1 Tax=Sphaerisporangium aureirubrum TaxID=1544736 RepID=A0ABW1NNP9_9ACTN